MLTCFLWEQRSWPELERSLLKWIKESDLGIHTKIIGRTHISGSGICMESRGGREGGSEDTGCQASCPFSLDHVKSCPCAFHRIPVLLATKVKSHIMTPSDLWVMNLHLLSGWFCAWGGAVSAETKGSHNAVPVLPWVPNLHHSGPPVSENKRWLALCGALAVTTRLQNWQVKCVRFPASQFRARKGKKLVSVKMRTSSTTFCYN